MNTWIRTHLFYIAVIGLGMFFLHEYMGEHDARLAAEATIKQSQAQVQTLQAQIVTEQKQAAATVAAIQAKVIAVRTPQQAIAAIPDVSTLPLNSRPAADGGITVDPLPLFQELSQCKIDAVNASSCAQQSAQKDSIINEQKTEITALKKKPSLWKRITGTAKAVGIGIGIGALLTHAL